MTDAPTDDATTEVDARGRLCPLPVIDLARAARKASPGDLIDLVANDPAAASDVTAWCRMRGHALVSSEPFDESATVYRVRIGAPGA